MSAEFEQFVNDRIYLRNVSPKTVCNPPLIHLDRKHFPHNIGSPALA